MKSPNPIAVEFARFVLETLPSDAEFLAIYDAMTRAASGHKFRNLGHVELTQIGVSFSLSATKDLEYLIEYANNSA